MCDDRMQTIAIYNLNITYLQYFNLELQYFILSLIIFINKYFSSKYRNYKLISRVIGYMKFKIGMTSKFLFQSNHIVTYIRFFEIQMSKFCGHIVTIVMQQIHISVLPE